MKTKKYTQYTKEFKLETIRPGVFDPVAESACLMHALGQATNLDSAPAFRYS